MIKQNQPLVISTPKGIQPYAPPVDTIEPREIVENLPVPGGDYRSKDMKVKEE